MNNGSIGMFELDSTRMASGPAWSGRRFPTPWPMSWKDELAVANVANGQPAPISLGDRHVSTPQRFQRKAGQPFEIASPQIHQRLTALYRDVEGLLHGYPLRDAQCVLVGKPYPQTDSDLELWLAPTIQHGEARKRFVPGENFLRMEVTQDRHRFADLRFRLRLAPGEMMVVTSTCEPRGLGELFFTDATTGQRHQRIVLIRLAQTQQDDLFETPDPNGVL